MNDPLPLQEKGKQRFPWYLNKNEDKFCVHININDFVSERCQFVFENSLN